MTTFSRSLPQTICSRSVNLIHTRMIEASSEATTDSFYFHRLKPVSTILKTCLSNTGTYYRVSNGQTLSFLACSERKKIYLFPFKWERFFTRAWELEFSNETRGMNSKSNVVVAKCSYFQFS